MCEPGSGFTPDRPSLESGMRLLLLFIIVLFCVFGCFAECPQKRELDPIELQSVVSHHLGAWIQTQVFWKRSPCSQQLSYLSSPRKYNPGSSCLLRMSKAPSAGQPLKLGLSTKD